MSIYAKAEIDRLRGEVEAGHRREAALTETIAMVRRQLDEERGTVDTYALFLDAVRESLALPDGEPAPYGYLAGAENGLTVRLGVRGALYFGRQGGAWA